MVPGENNCRKLIILWIFLAAGFLLLVLLDIVVLTEKDAHLSSVNCFVVQSKWVEAFVTVV